MSGFATLVSPRLFNGPTVHNKRENAFHTCKPRTVFLFVVNHKFVLITSARQLVGDKFPLLTNQVQLGTPWVKNIFA